jgi:hypothetical protein
MFRKQVIEAMAAVEREYRAAERAIILLHQGCQSDPAALGSEAITLADVRQCMTHLGDTYLVRLFAVFEEALREVWATAYKRSSHPRTYDLMQGCAARQHVRHDDLAAAHLVREYRNSILHGGEAVYVAVPHARSYLCTFFGWMPRQW